MLRVHCFVLVALAVSIAGEVRALADEPVDIARAKYREGVYLAKGNRWSEALARFEASAKLYPDAQTTKNIGDCERALGRYVLARATLSRALEESATAGNPLPESMVTETKGFIAQIDLILARVTVAITPPDAAIAVDGRPLAVQLAEAGAKRPVAAAGVLPPGPGAPPPAKTFDLVLDPGAHVIILSRKGFADAVVNKTFTREAPSTLDLELELLPATLKITSTQLGALVHVDATDVGPVPVDVLRPAGSYRVIVKKDGFLPYSAQVTVRPGEEVKLRASLLEDKPSIVKKWWFWTAAATVVGGGVVGTYFATRPKPQPPPYNGGSTGWVVMPTALRF